MTPRTPLPAPERTAPERTSLGRRRPRSSHHDTHRLAYWLILPAGLAELLIHIIPMALGVWIAFTSLTQLNIRNWVTAPFIWFGNFIAGLNPEGPIGGELYTTFVRTVLYVAIVLALSWMLGMAGAVFLTSKVKGRAFLRTFFLVPYALPGYVGTIAWAFMFNQRDGAINRFLVDDLHLLSERPFWLIGDNAFIVLVVVSVWQMWPFAFLMLLAALQNVPDDVYEAAAIDGASLWRRFTAITLPMVRPANAVMLLVMGLWLFNQFNVPFILFGAGAPESARLISPLIYEHSFVSWNFGIGSAMSVLLLLALFAASVVYIRIVLPKGQNRA